jgi:hypothetical protein
MRRVVETLHVSTTHIPLNVGEFPCFFIRRKIEEEVVHHRQRSRLSCQLGISVSGHCLHTVCNKLCFQSILIKLLLTGTRLFIREKLWWTLGFTFRCSVYYCLCGTTDFLKRGLKNMDSLCKSKLSKV